MNGEPLALSLGWRLDANSHLTGVAVRRSCAGSGQGRSGGPVFFLGSLGRTLYALDRQGKVEWQARLPGLPPPLPGPIYALAVTGEGDWPDSLAVAGDNGVTLVSMAGGRLWHRDLGTRITALESDLDCGQPSAGLLAGGWDERLTSLDSQGNVVWQADVGAPVSGVAWLAGGKVAVAGTLDGELWAFDRSGEEVWRLAIGPGVSITGLAPLPEEDGTALLVGLQNGRLVALDTAADQDATMPRQEAGGEPQVRWQQLLGEGGPVWHSADVDGDGAPEIVVGTGGNTPQLALLSSNGELAWRVVLPSPVNTVAVLKAEGSTALLAGLASGEIQAFDERGRRRASVHAGDAAWHLAADGGDAVVLADVVAWQIKPGAGPAGSAWFKLPAFASLSANMVDLQAGAEGTAVLVFLGDVVPGRSMEAQLARYGPAYPWGGLGPLLRQADLAVANLESVLTTQGQPLNKPYVIRAHPRSGQTLVEAGLDLVSLANNHALDYGQVGLDETLSTLDRLGIVAMGAGCRTGTSESPSSGGDAGGSCQAGKPALFTLNGVRVAVLGYAGAYWNGSADMPASDRIAWAEPTRVQADVRAARDQADVVVVMLHAGVEYAARPSSTQVAVAHAAIDAGADLVVGHHPHVTQTVERYDGPGDAGGRHGLIVYSLGNAVFDIPRQAAMQGDLLRVYVTRDGLQRAELWPFWIEDAIRPRLLAGDDGNPRFSVIYSR
jgi:poly-gamma-glutamate capsule biosynthesis protein CapA/YwtB (metallophosphatase superfamily)